MIARKEQKKSETLINTNVSIIKTTLEKDGRNSTKMWFSHLKHLQNFVRKVKQFVRKYYITWFIDLANKLYNDIEKLLISFYAMCN